MIRAKKVFVLLLCCICIFLQFFLINSEEGQAVDDRFNMSYLYFGSKDTHVQFVDQTNGALQVISPSYFNLDENGNLATSKLLDESFIVQMHEREIKVVPFLSNHWNRELGKKALTNRENLASQIVEVIEMYDLDGVNIDIENVTHIERNDYTDFIRILREKLPEDKEISVAVSANPYGVEVGWHGSYDYSEMVKYCDYLMVMAYDQSYYGSQPGPIAGIDFVEKSIQYALEKAPSEKIVLGIPFYGRYWNSGEEKSGRGIHLTVLDTLLKKYNAETVYNEEYKSPMATFEIKEDDESFYVFGRMLTLGNYTIWYENEESIKAKLDLVKKYDLKGTGSWSLGQELPSTWEYYSDYLNEDKHDQDQEYYYFSDITDHWAESDIFTIKNKGWMKGYDNGLFMPDLFLTRAQAAVTLVRVLQLEVENDVESSFKDVSPTYWAKNEIDIAKNHNIIRGIDDEHFAPEKPISREEMATMLNRVLVFENMRTDLIMPYTDIDSNRWSYDAIYSMVYNGIFRGFEDDTVRPSENITRAQMASLLNRISRYID